MEDLFTKFQKTSQVKMTDDERSAMRSRLFALTQATRASVPAAASAPRRAPMFSFARAKAVPALAVAVAVLSTGGGVYAAEASLPGDALYPVKTHVIENVRTALTVSPEAKAKWESELATRRLEEIEHLASVGELDEKKAAELQEKFEAHSDKVAARIDEMRDRGEDARGIAAEHDGSLRAHGRVLTKLNAANEGMFVSIAASVNARAEATEMRVRDDEDDHGRDRGNDADRGGSARLNDEDDAAPVLFRNMRSRAVLGMKNAAAEKIAVLERMATRQNARVEWADDLRGMLDAAHAAFAEGNVLLEAGDHDAAFASFRGAHDAAQEAKAFGIAGFRNDRSVDRNGGDRRDDDGSDDRRVRDEDERTPSVDTEREEDQVRDEDGSRDDSRGSDTDRSEDDRWDRDGRDDTSGRDGQVEVDVEVRTDFGTSGGFRTWFRR